MHLTNQIQVPPEWGKSAKMGRVFGADYWSRYI